MKRVCMYLRKSRADEEAEKSGKGETLSKHRQILLKTADEMGLDIIRIRQEVVSGESLMHRPQMLELLKEVEQGMYDAVLCMDLDRLGRGNMQEQGLILETFKKSDTKIITPRKIYDLQNEFDEEYSEFEAFMARKELKIINRRLQRGRIKSIEDGNYIGALPPYGYRIHYEGKNRTLKPHPEQSKIVKLIFNLYVNHGYGGGKIAKKLNELGYKTYTGKKWNNYSVINIIKNEVYTGKVTWKKKKYKKSTKPNQNKEVKSLPRSKWITAEGKHEGIISEEMYWKAQKILNNRTHVPYNVRVTNPLAGLIRCGICGHSMVYRTYSKSSPHIICYNKCGNKSSKFEYVEERLLKALKQWLNQYKVNWNKEWIYLNGTTNISFDLYEKSLKKFKRELKELLKQKDNLHNLLERGIYDENTYNERLKIIKQRIENIKRSTKNIKKEMQNIIEENKLKKEIIPQFKNILDIYFLTNDAEMKNRLLKCVLEKVIYIKKKYQRNDEFTLKIYPKLPEQTEKYR